MNLQGTWMEIQILYGNLVSALKPYIIVESTKAISLITCLQYIQLGNIFAIAKPNLVTNRVSKTTVRDIAFLSSKIIWGLNSLTSLLNIKNLYNLYLHPFPL